MPPKSHKQKARELRTTLGINPIYQTLIDYKRLAVSDRLASAEIENAALRARLTAAEAKIVVLQEKAIKP